ncbi:microfibril-associated glycoprotein 4-like [Malaya genurostris]|uniref:microfibril-associated glycoprotein 4-like n=1 Tax=Malaya genurostris TaxID=325434 RepID=UPI0026F3D210|nr:microfibril-associated glycoprotein 4-like [Malaya genurostris]XP_058453926.1 microfibril-associated glycoprotein 4-like [Malaya genurostris]
MVLSQLVFLSVLSLLGGVSSLETNVTSSSAFGYELTMTGLDAINFSMQKDHLRSQEYFQTLSSEIELLRRYIEKIEAIVIRQTALVSDLHRQLKNVANVVKTVEIIPNIQSDLQMQSINISQLLKDSSNIYKIQQTLPTTKMLNDFVLQLTADRFRTASAESSRPFHLLQSANLPQSCAEVADRRSGVNRIHPQAGFSDSFEAYCDQDYEGGGWTVIQNRYDGSVNFYRGWSEYENGFGDLRGEFWLGLQKIHELTGAKHHELHVLMEDSDGKIVVAKYSHILVGGVGEKYALNSLGNYSGNAGDSLSWAVTMKFSTLDSDNDSHPPDNCAVIYKGGWWYGACHESNLNGLYLGGPQEAYATMMCWAAFRGLKYGLKRSRMMIKATSS